VLRVLEPALRMKAQTDSNRRSWKDFIYREFSWRKSKRKTAYWGKQGDPETSYGVGVGFYSLFALSDCGDAFQMQTGISYGREVSP
jgi:hypothetical protein